MDTAAHRRLREWRSDLGASASELARRTGIEQSYMSRLLAGTRRAGLDAALAIERASAGWAEGPITVAEWGTDEDEEGGAVAADAAR